VAALTDVLVAASVDDRLAASSPYLTMVATMICGWLMERQGAVAAALLGNGQGDPSFLKAKVATVNWYLAHLVPEASGLAASVILGARGLYDLSAEELAA